VSALNTAERQVAHRCYSELDAGKERGHESLLEDIWAESWKKEYIRLGAISSTTSFRHAATHANVYK
jgi:hypothetical protein